MEVGCYEEIRGERALCAAVIVQAIDDLQKPGVHHTDRRTAISFLEPENPVFRFYAIELDHDPAWLSRKIWDNIDKNLGFDRKLSPYLNINVNEQAK